MTDLEIKVNNALSTFEKLNISYTIESLKFFIDNKISVPELKTYSEENMLYLLVGGLKEKSLEEGYKVILELLSVGLDLETIHALCKEKCYEQGFSLGEVGMAILTKMSENPNKQMIAAEPLLQNIASMLETMQMNDTTIAKKKH